jgi:hypothetical protein
MSLVSIKEKLPSIKKITDLFLHKMSGSNIKCATLATSKAHTTPCCYYVITDYSQLKHTKVSDLHCIDVHTKSLDTIGLSILEMENRLNIKAQAE